MANAPWVAINIDYWRNPKVAEAGFLAAALNLAAIAYCAEQLTDGFVPMNVVPILAAPMHGYVWVGEDGKNPTPADVADSRWANLAEALVFAGLWAEATGGWRIVNYLEHQPSRADVERRKEQAREAGRQGGLKRGAKRTAKQPASESLSAPFSETVSGTQAPTPTPTPLPTPSSSTSGDLEVEVELREASPSNFAEEDPSEVAAIRSTLALVVTEKWNQELPEEFTSAEQSA